MGIRDVSTQLSPVLQREGERQEQERAVGKIATKRLMPVCSRFELRKTGSVRSSLGNYSHFMIFFFSRADITNY